jgi:hypothetical protein
MVMKKNNNLHLIALLVGTTALAGMPAFAQDAKTCASLNGPVPPACVAPNGKTVVDMPVGENTELDRNVATSAPEGFVISVDGQPLSGDQRMVDSLRRADLALAETDVQVTFDGLQLSPRLDLEVVGGGGSLRPGDPVTFQSATNYPAFLKRAEVRIIDRSAPGGPETLGVFPVDPNGQVTVDLPEGKDLVAVHRVYDADGRYDETTPLALGRRDARGPVDGVEEGNDSTALRHIPLTGGSVTLYGKNLSPGARVQTLGEVVRPAPGGDFVLQRILPIGTHEVEVAVDGDHPVAITREVEIPRTEWFYVGTADLTYGLRDQEGVQDDYAKGRLAFYLKGRTAAGLSITAAADTGEGDLDTLFRDLDKTDPRTFLLRIDPDDYYPVYGDDSTYEEDAPTSGRFYVKLAKGANHLLWGNFKNRFENSTYLMGERALYGLQGHVETKATTENGDARASLTFFGANPEHLPQRDIFLGTGGSIYFLQRQDIAIGSEFVSVEVRDAVSGRVIQRRLLTYGRDYDINYVQGTITLNRPLSGSTSGGVVTGTSQQVNLVVQYEWTPTGSDLDAISYGARAETWVTDDLRLGVTGQVDQGGSADQRALGADLRWQLSDETYVQIEKARSDGPGYASSRSMDGGLIFDSDPLVAGTGEALKFDARLGFSDLGLTDRGYVGLYYESRGKGFSTFDTQVLADETLWGVAVEADPTEDLHLTLKYDDYQSDNGKTQTTGTAEAKWQATERLAYTVGLLQTDRKTTSVDGDRTDAALRLTFTESEALEWYVYGQATLTRDGLDRNDRVGLGVAADLGKNWSIEGEVSQGTSGSGGRALLTRNYGQGESYYFGYELDPDRDPDGTGISGRDGGKYTLGGRRKITDSVATWGENTYDLFGQSRSLTSAYGVDYAPTDHLTYSLGIEYGDVTDDLNGDFTRKGLSLGLRYQDGDRLAASGKLEWRSDDGADAAASRDTDTVLLKGTALYRLNEAERVSFNLEAVTTTGSGTAVPDGTLIDSSVGYALRPVADDRLNLLFKYRFLYDMYGQKVDGTTTPGPRQRSHVLSVDADYDLNRHWTIGGKLGLRLSDSAPNATTALAENNAWLAVVNARYHLVHEWDALIEARTLRLDSAGTTDVGFLGALYKQFGNNVELGVGYNFGQFSDDLTDLTMDDKGIFVNLVAKF